MGNLCATDPLPHEEATTIFLAYWEEFVLGQKDVITAVRLRAPWRHIDANTWAKSKADEIRLEMEDRGWASEYHYKVEGAKRVGTAVLFCKHLEMERTFQLEVSYDA